MAVALALSILLGPTGRLQARRAPADSTHEHCSVTVDDPVLCPEDFTYFNWDWTAPPGGAAVIAGTTPSFVEVRTGQGTEKKRTPDMERTDVKGKLRGWCRLFPDPATARRVAADVGRLLARRQVLYDEHRNLRTDIHSTEEKLDKERREYADVLQGRVDEDDESETLNNISQRWSKIAEIREKARKRDAQERDTLKKKTDKLREVLRKLEAKDDDLIKAIDQKIDDEITRLLGVPALARVCEVEKVRYEATTSAQRLAEDNPNLGGGWRMFPDANALGGSKQDRVTVIARVKPVVPGVDVRFKLLDRDDFTSNHAELDPNGRSGADNALGRQGDLDGGGFFATKLTDAQGEARVTLTVTMQPGDNFEVAADCDSTLVNSQTDDGASKNEVPDRISSGMLTVWRRVFVETGTMGSLAMGQGVEHYDPAGVTHDFPTPDPNGTVKIRVEFDGGAIDTGDSRGRFAPGRVRIDQAPDPLPFLPEGLVEKGYVYENSPQRAFEVLESAKADDGVRWELTLRIHHQGRTRYLPAEGSRVTVFDDDFNLGPVVSDRGLLPSLPVLDQARAIYPDAFVEIRDGVPGLAGALHGETFLQKYANSSGLNERELLEEHFDAFKAGGRKPWCWISHMGMTFQGPMDLDHDPDQPEQGFLNGSPPERSGSLGTSWGAEYGSTVYIETTRDLCVARHGYDDAQIAVVRAKIVAHELTHQWGLGNAAHADGGILAVGRGNGGPEDAARSTPIVRKHLRQIRTRELGPE
jgi:hypothetical protein